jgi:hypothetical protein
VVPCDEIDSFDCFIGVPFDDIAARLAERGWQLTRDSFNKIPPPASPPPAIDPQFWKNFRDKFFATHGYDINDLDDDGSE